ncbi:hypothetical protein KQ874_03245 [Mycoplasma sp. ES3157-GEN-MYC]|uniref:Uncharacterized protein n=1 Tax=Mycoplasma miroungigenitalium TaxID=754515 RepID=A0A6M4JA41_9MOLU|nr:hypothetical protein [Mycoplasma miroungigenitalium]MBU4690692.1 hypothetical protein [Mycoplasma miroungigenitalium]MBU4691961.1 hypothetical protein [Mycoplasma miroungigenitalium]QJR43813.1 hypothetical protein HLA87_03440 [Mycoplasma miroungigenitalium]
MAKRKYNGVDYDLDVVNQTLKLRTQYHEDLLSKPAGKGFKKFGGSSIGNIFETDSFKGQFLAFLHMARLAPPIFVKKYVKAGEAVEPMVFDLMKKKFPKLDIEHIEASKVGYDYFKETHDIVGGVPDGLIPSKKIVLEMKAVQAKKQAIWEQNNNLNVPLDYRKQAELYAYLLGYPRYSIVATYLEEGDYEKPELIDLNQRNIAQYMFDVDQNKARDDLETIVKFWKYYSRTGISPKYDARRDAKVVEYLMCHNEQEWEELFNKWKRFGDVDEDIEFWQVK